MDLILIIILAYVMGSIPFGYLLTKTFLKKDIRNIGSGNIGATNALRISKDKVLYPIILFPVLSAFVAPMLPEPIFLISFFRNILVNT